MVANFDILKKKIAAKKANIAVVGLGYVGLPLALAFAKKGINVLGIEIDKGRLENIRKKTSYITDISTKELRAALDSGKFTAKGDFSPLADRDVIIICVPTPLKRKYHPNITYIRQAVKSIAKNIKTGSLVILESTTYPGTTEEVILPLLEAAGLKHGRDFYLSFSPERIDPGNLLYPVHKIPKVVGGISPEATTLATLVYKNIIDKVVPVSSARVAEFTKLLENTFRLVNIGLIDELAMMAHKMGIAIWEVIDAASTKPFGFMPFYPGPGVGGHCLDKNETVFIKDGYSLKTMRIPEFIDYIRDRKDDTEILSFDPVKRRSIFRKVVAASARPYNGPMFDITTEDGRHLKVTDLHPMFVYTGKSWQLKYAKDLLKGDLLPLSLKLPSFDSRRAAVANIDIIEEIAKNGVGLIEKIRVRPVGFSWKDYALEIKTIVRQDNQGKLSDTCWDYFSDNVLPLTYFYRLEELVKIDHSRLKLVSGRGPSCSEMPAVIELSEDFCRLIGYYLSEGCYTKDKSARIRFSFNRSEKEYIEDVISILRPLGIRTSIYESKRWHTSCIKVSSNLFGFLIRDILRCGANCYEMSVPERLFSLDLSRKKALVSGLLNGDGCVEHFFGKWRYRKNEKEFFHNVNTANISFFTSSKTLFQQLIILLHDLNIVSTFKKRQYALSIFGYRQLAFFRDMFRGKKREIIEKYLELNKNRPRNKTFKKIDKFAVVKVRSISETKGDWVYSVETDKPHSFVTSYGIVVHNCIPKDPLYLYWKARHAGFRSRFIKLASDVINFMPEYVVKRLEEALKVRGLALAGAKVLVLGLTYKKDILDLRQSPSLGIVEILRKFNAGVSYHDPLIPYLNWHDLDMKSIKLNKGSLAGFDAVIIATDHSAVDYDLVLKNSKLILDTRRVYKGSNSGKVVLL
ncbi:MAG: nucleotide sugar dehydrogenase [Candidatus Omnitrophota bacterium]|nr:nucleotide sugar dehydrogenase [Candidatus Omnitrophota bacterium]